MNITIEKRYDILVDVLKEEFGATATLSLLERVNEKIEKGI